MPALSSLAATSITPAQQAALQGWGTALTGGTVASQGQAVGNSPDINAWVANLNAAFPGVNASFKDQTTSEGTDAGGTVQFDPSKLPAGFMQAATGANGGIELDAPDSKWGGADSPIINKGAIENNGVYGRTTGQGNIRDINTGVGVWGPLAMSAVLGLAGGAMGGLGGFGGMSDAAAQGLVSGATGSGLGAGSFAGLAGLSPVQTINTGLGVVQNATNGGSPLSILSQLLPALGSVAGLPSYASTIGRLLLSQAQKPGAGG